MSRRLSQPPRSRASERCVRASTPSSVRPRAAQIPTASAATTPPGHPPNPGPTTSGGSSKDGITAAERLLLEDTVRLGIIMRAEQAVYMQTQRRDAASRMCAVAGQRRANLQAVGLQRTARQVTVAGVVSVLEAEKDEAS